MRTEDGARNGENPGRVSFMARFNDRIEDFIRDNPTKVATHVLQDRRFVVGTIEPDYIEVLADTCGISPFGLYPFVVGLMSLQGLYNAGIFSLGPIPGCLWQGEGTLVGIIDTGIDYTSRAFKDEAGNSRIRFLYDQSGEGPAPEGFLCGTEYTNEQINKAIRSENPYDLVPVRDEVGHGTFLASVSAGSCAAGHMGAAPKAELIVVKLKEASEYYRRMYLVPREQKNAYESSDVVMGIEYILQKAQLLKKPVSICLGVGTNQGGHDGFSLFEEYLCRVSSITGVCLTAAGGNEGQRGHHFYGKLKKTGDILGIEIKVGAGAGDIYLSIWNNAVDRISVSVTAPSGETVGRAAVRPETQLSARLMLDKSMVDIAYHFPQEGSGAQLTVVRIFNATPGIWTVTVYGDIVLDGAIHAWLPIAGFVSPDVAFLSANSDCTVVVPATAAGVIACGAYDFKNDRMWPYSSWGPSRLPAIRPDLVAPGVGIYGALPGGYGVMSGTSVAAAITAGAAALILQWGIVQRNDPKIGTYAVKAYLIRGCSRETGEHYPNTREGYGRLNLARSFEMMQK